MKRGAMFLRIVMMASLSGVASMSLAGNLGTEVLLTAEGRHSFEPSVAFGNGKYLVVWRAGANENSDIVGMFLNADGKPEGSKPFGVCSAKDWQEQPRAVFGGDKFLVVWSDMRGGKDFDVFGTRVSLEGKVLDPEGFPVCAEQANQCRPALVFDGKQFVVAWEDFRGAKEEPDKNGFIGVFSKRKTYDICFTYVSPDGKPQDSRGLPAMPGATVEWPALACGANGKLLLASETGYGIFAGQPVGEKDARKYGGRDFGERGRALTPSVSSSGDGYMIVCGNFRPIGRGGGGGKGSTALLLNSDGQPVTDIAIDSKSTPVFRPASAWDGTAYIVAWSIVRNGGGGPKGPTRRWEAVFVSRFGKDGKLLDDGLAVSGSFENPARLVSVASDGKGSSLLAYERHPDKPDGFIQVGLRMLGDK